MPFLYCNTPFNLLKDLLCLVHLFKNQRNLKSKTFDCKKLQKLEMVYSVTLQLETTLYKFKTCLSVDVSLKKS